MKRLAILLAVAACSDPAGPPPPPPPPPPDFDITGRWTFNSFAAGCQVLGTFTVTAMDGAGFSATATGIRGCASSFTSFTATFAGTLTADSVHFNLDASTAYRGLWNEIEMTGQVTMASGLGSWSAGNCAVITSCPPE